MRLLPKQWLVGPALILAVLIAIALWWRQKPGKDSGPATPPASPAGSTSPRLVPPPAPDEPRRLFWAAAGQLKKVPAAEDARRILAELQATLRSLPAATGSALIREILDSRMDAPSHLDFAVGADGFLKQPSSLRVFLLDELAKIDPNAAANYAEGILSSKDSPDEWAVSLRNYALGRTNAGDLSYLRNKVREMIRHEPWQKDAPVSYLEAFDAAVFAGGTDLLPDLTELVRQKENKAVAHAAYLTLDRLTIQDPAPVLEQLQREPALMEGREATRANYFARAVVSDARQKAVLENYLLDPRRSPAELQVFAGIFPSGNYMISHNLLTHNPTPTGDMLAAQDRASRQVIEDWMSDPRFERLRPELNRIHERLKSFVSPQAAPPPVQP